MIAVTVNQALDKILSKYKSEEIKQNKTLNKWKESLFLCKLKFGGNTKLEDSETVNNVIETGNETTQNMLW